MALTKISRGLLSTGVSDSSDATAITIDSSENVGIGCTPVQPFQVRTQSDGNVVFQNSTSVTGGVKINCFNDAANASKPFEIDGSSLQFNIASSLKARIDSDGLKFGSDTAAANALDDYEEGTWTATLSSSSGGFAASTTSFSGGQYNKIGNLVTAHIYTGSFNITNAGSGYAKVSGLPYTSRTGTYDYGSVIFYHTDCFQVACPTGYVAGGADFTIASRGDQTTVGAQSWGVANGVYLMLQVQYQAA